ncbi:MAG: ComF family protein [Woeseia sp.]
MFRPKKSRHRLVDRVIRCAFPDSCVLCGAQDVIGWFCINCSLTLPRADAACGRCGQTVSTVLPPGVDCADCQRRPPPFLAARSALLYTFPIDSALQSFKYNHQLYYAPAFAQLLFAEFLLAFQTADALLPVPLHFGRHAWRGFNQAMELCKPLRRCSGLPVLTNVGRVRYTRPQTGLDAAARRRNLRHAFAVAGPLRCRRPLIIDDVMTTGETCRRLARVLLDAGASDVGVLTVARADAAAHAAGLKV